MGHHSFIISSDIDGTMEWHLCMRNGGWDDGFSAELSEIDPGLPAVVGYMAEQCVGRTKVSELISQTVHGNPLDYPPSEKNDYEHMIDRFLLDAYMKAGASNGTDCLWETIRKPGKTKCCSPYSGNMYRHLSETTDMSVEETDEGVELVLYFDDD